MRPCRTEHIGLVPPQPQASYSQFRLEGNIQTRWLLQLSIRIFLIFFFFKVLPEVTELAVDGILLSKPTITNNNKQPAI